MIFCLPPRQGSIIADLELTFNTSIGQSNVKALLTQAANKGKIGDMEVEDVRVGETFPGQFFCLGQLLLFCRSQHFAQLIFTIGYARFWETQLMTLYFEANFLRHLEQSLTFLRAGLTASGITKFGVSFP